MKIEFETKQKPNPIYNKIIVAHLSEEFAGITKQYRVLYSSMHKHPHYHEYGEEIPIDAIEEWVEIV